MRALALRQYRVSHLGAHAAQEVGHLAGRDRARRGSGPGRCHVVRVVRAGHGSIPAPPPATTLRMALALTGRRPAGPLPGPQAGMGTEQSLAEGAGRTPGARSGHRSPPGLRWTRYPNNNSGPHSGCIHSGRSKTTQVGFSLGGRTRTMISGDAPDRISPGHGYRCCGGKWSRRRRCAQLRGVAALAPSLGWGWPWASEGSTVPLPPTGQQNRRGGKGPWVGVGLNGPRGGRLA